MIRFAFAFIFINTYHSCIGIPVTKNEPRSSIANQLQSLWNGCENQFLVDLIKSKSEYCNTSVAVFSQPELECLMFYDINKQMCATFGHSKYNLQDNYTSKIKADQDVVELCKYAEAWKLSDLDVYQKQKVILEKVFKKDVSCQKLCGVDDFTSQDSNFFCKYFKWGSDLLNNHDLTSVPQNVDVPAIVENNIINPIQEKTVLSSTLNNDNTSTVKKEGIILATNDASSKTEESANSELQSNHTSTHNSVSKLEDNDYVHKSDQTSVSNLASSDKNEIEKPSPMENPSNKDTDVKINNQHEKDPNEGDINKPQPPNQEVDDDQENDSDPDLDDADPLADQDDMDGVLLSDPKLTNDKVKSSAKKIESMSPSFNNDVAQREIFPNTIQDTFTDDDDHFFPLFLTAIILVVLLYILYHNKNKFTKVILGLIVEGRQPGRRRNSRGHAYRRLDTLEQAMSTNTAAPPSKIIY